MESLQPTLQSDEAGVSDTLYNEPGGLSGRPLFVQSKRCVEISRKAVGEKFLDYWVWGYLKG